MSAIYENPGEVRWIVKDGRLVLQQLWRKITASADGPVERSVWRTVAMPEFIGNPLAPLPASIPLADSSEVK